jgi:mannonate dehydratase
MAFATFDLHLLKRPGAHESYSEHEQHAAAAYAESLSENQQKQLFQNILLGLPGSSVNFTPEQLLKLLDGYSGIDETAFRKNLVNFLEAVVPVAEEEGSKLAIHPDDPPFSLLGLPRIMSTMDDADKIFNAVPSVSNGLCFCSGSLGAHEENDLPAILDAFEDRVHFIHLRNVLKSGNRNFRESPHLDGDNPMEKIIEKILLIMQKRNIALPVRPDHGFLFDAEIHKDAYPGYSLMGRMKGLAEITGLERGILFKLNQ